MSAMAEMLLFDPFLHAAEASGVVTRSAIHTFELRSIAREAGYCGAALA
jgi:hypothetical protein